MQTNVYLKCNICGAICDLKYQMGFSKKHPIRYRCTCGVCIRGEYTENVGITFENATEIKQKNLPDFVVHSSGELLTLPPYSVTCVNDIMRPTSFILSTLMMDYETISIRLLMQLMSCIRRIIYGCLKRQFEKNMILMKYCFH